VVLGITTWQGVPAIQQQEQQKRFLTRGHHREDLWKPPRCKAQRSKFGLGDNFGEEFKESAAPCKAKNQENCSDGLIIQKS